MLLCVSTPLPGCLLLLDSRGAGEVEEERGGARNTAAPPAAMGARIRGEKRRRKKKRMRPCAAHVLAG